MMKSHTPFRLVHESFFCLAYPHCTYFQTISHKIVIPVIRSTVMLSMLVFKQSLLYLIAVPKCKSSNAHNLDMPNRSYKMFLLWGNVKVLDLIRKKIIS
jgi:hypothetical protein